MTTIKKELSELMWQHKAIIDHIKFLTDSLSDLATPSSQLKKQTTFYSSLYRWSLYDFRETIRRHIELDERIFKMLPGSAPIKFSRSEHDKIQKQVDSAIWLAENAVYNKLSREELNKCTSDTIEASDRICASITEHVAKEDKILEFLQKGS